MTTNTCVSCGADIPHNGIRDASFNGPYCDRCYVTVEALDAFAHDKLARIVQLERAYNILREAVLIFRDSGRFDQTVTAPAEASLLHAAEAIKE